MLIYTFNLQTAQFIYYGITRLEFLLFLKSLEKHSIQLEFDFKTKVKRKVKEKRQKVVKWASSIFLNEWILG